MTCWRAVLPSPTENNREWRPWRTTRDSPHHSTVALSSPSCGGGGAPSKKKSLDREQKRTGAAFNPYSWGEATWPTRFPLLHLHAQGRHVGWRSDSAPAVVAHWTMTGHLTQTEPIRMSLPGTGQGQIAGSEPRCT